MLFNTIIGGTGGMTAEIFVTGLSETDTVTCTKDGKIKQGKWISKTNPAVSVPAGYTQLEYIESSGTQYINTDVSAPNGFKAILDWMFTDFSGDNNKAVLGSEDSAAPWACNWLQKRGGSGYYWSLGAYSVFGSSTAISANTRYSIDMSTIKGDSYLKVDGNSIITDTNSNDRSSNALYIFANNNAGTVGNLSPARLYSCKIIKDDETVRNYIPAKRNSDGVVGLYDLVSKLFFTNAGTGTFTAGSEIPSATSGWLFDKLKEYGTYTITATDGTDTVSDQIEFSEQSKSVELSFVSIYGISRDITNSSPVWARTDKAVGMTATATVGAVAGSSDFDNAMPWKGIVRETLSTGDVMVKIPKFYFQRYREGNVEHIRIADKAKSGFTLHPAFNHSGVEKDYLYVGAYKTTSGSKSISGVGPLVSQTRAYMRSDAKAKGTGWGIIDIAALSAIQMLILVEFANNNVQSVIGRGYCDNNSRALSTGTCDNVSGLTGRPAGTDGFVDVVWRGIEGFWGNVWEWVDGVNWYGGTYYVCNDPSKYTDDTSMNYTALSFKGASNWSSSYITQEGLDTGSNPHVMLPSVAGSGSETTYVCDACWSSAGWRVFLHGGVWSIGSFCGLFAASLDSDSSYSGSALGSRLLYIPS